MYGVKTEVTVGGDWFEYHSNPKSKMNSYMITSAWYDGLLIKNPLNEEH